MRVGIIQIDCQIGAVVANLQNVCRMVEQAARADCDMVVLPEMSDTGYDVNQIPSCAAAWDAGPHRTLRELAADLGIAIACGLSERDNDRVYNSLTVIDEKGTPVAAYRKTHLFTAAPLHEDRCFARGDKLTVTEVRGFKVGLMICYDIRFPEIARQLTLRGAELLLIVAAWPAVRVGHWRTLTEARAIENQVYVVASNRTGTDGPVRFAGNSRLIDPGGLELAGAGQDEETLIIGEIDRSRIEEVRGHMPVFEDRRGDLYG